jgi:hypothetical protein
MFMKMYEIQLAKLDYNDIMKRTEDLCERVRMTTQFEGEPIAVFIVHEAPDNPCSERAAIQKFFWRNYHEIHKTHGTCSCACDAREQLRCLWRYH